MLKKIQQSVANYIQLVVCIWSHLAGPKLELLFKKPVFGLFLKLYLKYKPNLMIAWTEVADELSP